MYKATALSSQSPEFKGIAGLNIIYEAGLDPESRPILVLCADNLPNPDIYDYDLILSFIMARLDEFVENDYVLVFFSSPARYRPGWFWLLKAYRSLDRKYKKNLKALYVVHLTRMYRIIFDLANRIVSPKFARKLNYVSSLSQLAAHIKLDSKFIPQRVVEYDRQLPVMNQASPLTGYSASSTSLAFGRTLEELASIEGKDVHGYIPRIVLQITDHIRKHGMDKEGIFRKSPSSEELRSVKKAYNQGLEVDLCQYDIDVPAALLKVFIRELPEPLISLSFSDKMGPVPDASICSQNTLDKIKASLREYYDQKPAHFQLLGYLCKFLKEVSENSSRNRMNIHNLSVVFTPNIIRAEEVTSGNYVNVPDNQHSALENATVYLKQMSQGMSLVELLIAKNQDIF
ncbi:Rho GTPase activation protein [Rhizopus microsporus ATCC 52813]|uniref:Rho GTPase activation protein n=1 Tax=Rhizopus microsporus ATCC 52813 TaxID=1340429 RepID=A0A2G4SGJ4_RHIZD|nr:Rho GTPase activation protein [Rhizopus microsporus ATCC 52813]PHZ07881.1 Rho GTPase activation protein [Rhizopus microsporus ATCC 52813]